MRGKKGPVPPVMEPPAEEPSAESIVGSEHVVDVGTGAETNSRPGGYGCADCDFSTDKLSALESHVAETGHGGGSVNPADPVQPELFSEKGVIHKSIQVPLSDELLNQKREELAELYQRILDVKNDKSLWDAKFNEQIKSIDASMQAIARVLKTPYTYETVDCEWRIITEENARGLYRLDTGEMIDKQPLTAEDRAEELAKAEADNTPAEPLAQETV